MENIEKQSFVWLIVKGALYALTMSLILILVFAFVLRFFGIGEGAISAIVQIIKGVAVLFGTLVAMKKTKEMGFLCGMTIGLIFTLLSFAVFSVLDNFTFEFSRTLLNDIVFGSIIGGICGIIAVNAKK